MNTFCSLVLSVQSAVPVAHILINAASRDPNSSAMAVMRFRFLFCLVLVTFLTYTIIYVILWMKPFYKLISGQIWTKYAFCVLALCSPNSFEWPQTEGKYGRQRRPKKSLALPSAFIWFSSCSRTNLKKSAILHVQIKLQEATIWFVWKPVGFK